LARSGTDDLILNCVLVFRPSLSIIFTYSSEEKKSEAGVTGRRFKGNGKQCGRQWHKKSECWEILENEDKIPAGYKQKTEYVHAAISSGSGI